MFGLSPAKLLLLTLIVLLVFGAGRLSDVGKGLGDAIRNFKKGFRDDHDSEKPPKP